MAQSRAGRTIDRLRWEQTEIEAWEARKLSEAAMATADVHPLPRSLGHEIKAPITVVETRVTLLFGPPHPLQRRHHERLVRILKHGGVQRLERLGEGLYEPTKGRGRAHGEWV